MAVLERSSSPAAAVAVAALIALASVAGVAGEVFFQEKFDGKHPDLTLSSWSLDLLSS
jgi:calreticulin